MLAGVLFTVGWVIVVGLFRFSPAMAFDFPPQAYTFDASLATAFALARNLKKGPILVADHAGFVVNRLLLRFMGEILAAIEEGTPPDVADTALDPLGCR